MSPEADDAYGRKSVRAALRAWDDSKALGLHPLAGLRVVEARRRAVGRGDSPESRGLSLRDVLRAAIEETKYSLGNPEPSEKGWRPYIILTEEFVAGRSQRYLMDYLGIARRTYQLEQAQAIDKLADKLRQWEDESRSTPTMAVEQGPFLAPPKPHYPLVGRYHLIQELKGRLLSGDSVALFALRGLPGVGKTALALELAHDPEVGTYFRDGILWAGLGREPDVLALLGRWATALGIGTEAAKLGAAAERADAIHTVIGRRHMLLVIDDAWKFEDALALQVGGLNCVHLVTTRSADIAQDFAEAGAVAVHELSDAAGLVLFAQLAPDVADAEPDEAQQLVRAVGGLPLAIILMARFVRREARRGSRPLRRALARLHEAEGRFQLDYPQPLVGRHPSLPSGAPVSLMAAIQISDRTLDEEAQAALRALSVFPPKPNTFPEEAALVVSATPPGGLSTLVDYGLLEPSGSDRYTLHQTIADYATLHLEDEAVCERMVKYFVSFAESHEAEHDALEPERDNILAALDLASRQGMNEALTQGTNAFSSYLRIRGLNDLAELRLRQAQRAAQVSGDRVGLIRTLINLGRVSNVRGDNEQAAECFKEGLDLAREIEHAAGISSTLQGMGWIAKDQGQYELAKEHYREALIVAREIGDHELIGSLLMNLGTIATNENDLAEARKIFLEGLSSAQRTGNAEVKGRLLQNLGAVAEKQGNYTEAEGFFRESLALAREAGDRDNIGANMQSLGVLAVTLGHFAQARQYFQESLTLAREVGHRARICLLLINLGVLETEVGDYARAQDHYQEGLALARELGHRERVSILLANLGDLASKLGEHADAEVYYQQSMDLAKEIGHRWLVAAIFVEWAEANLQHSNWDTAAAQFQEGLEMAQQAGLQEYEAKALHGLGQVALAQGDVAVARERGCRSLAIFEKIGHKNASDVKEWLDALP